MQSRSFFLEFGAALFAPQAGSQECPFCPSLEVKISGSRLDFKEEKENDN